MALFFRERERSPKMDANHPDIGRSPRHRRSSASMIGQLAVDPPQANGNKLQSAN